MLFQRQTKHFPCLQAAAVALSALISAMYETNLVAVARRVYAANSAPRLGMLIPHIKTNYQVLVIFLFQPFDFLVLLIVKGGILCNVSSAKFVGDRFKMAAGKAADTQK